MILTITKESPELSKESKELSTSYFIQFHENTIILKNKLISLSFRVGVLYEIFSSY